MAVVGNVDPGVLVTMKLASELMDARAQLAHQRTTILSLAAALRSQQAAMAVLHDVIDTLLSEPGSDG
jgi:hypothetical protein